MTNKEKQDTRNIAQILIEPVIAVNNSQSALITGLDSALNTLGESVTTISENVATVQETLADQLLALANDKNQPVLAGVDGNLKLDTYFDDLVVPLTTGKVGANAKPDFDYTNIGYLFPQNDTAEALYMVVQLPHKYKEGSAIYPHVHYRRTSGGKPVFKIDYSWFNIGDAPSAPTTVYTMSEEAITYTSGTIQQIAKNSTPIDGTGKKISSLLLIKLYRDDNVVTGDVLAWQFDIHVECDTLGSEEEYIK